MIHLIILKDGTRYFKFLGICPKYIKRFQITNLLDVKLINNFQVIHKIRKCENNHIISYARSFVDI